MVLPRRYTVVLEEVAEDTLECYEEDGSRDVSGSTRKRLSERVLEELGRLWHHGRLQLSLRNLQGGLSRSLRRLRSSRVVQISAHGMVETVLRGAQCLDRSDLAGSCRRPALMNQLLPLSFLLSGRQILLVLDVNLLRDVQMARLKSLLACTVGQEATLAGNTRGIHHWPLVERFHLLDEADVFGRSLRHATVERL